MMGSIIRLHGDQHSETQKLLPWYVTGQLDPADRAAVEAHLGGCAECSAELRFERRLSAEVGGLPLDAGLGLAELRDRLTLDTRKDRRIGEAASSLWRAIVGPRRLGWFLAGQAALVSLAAMLVFPPAPPAAYRALGTGPARTEGNLIVIFRPETSERDLRRTLNASHARLVDGPTASAAYVLHVPAAERSSVLAKLRAQSQIVLAEPIDADAAP